MKPTLKNARELLRFAGPSRTWGGFKHALMKELGIPANEYGHWDVPVEWRYLYRRACGWSDLDARKQLDYYKPAPKE